MPTTPREVLAQLVVDVAALTARVAKLEAADTDGWDEPFETEALPIGSAAPPPLAQRAMETAADGIIDFGSPNEAQRIQRADLVDRLELENLPKEHGQSKTEANAAYLSGGPLWLYLLDRDFVMTLSQELRAALVDDLIAGGFEQDATELGRDILKDDGESRRGAEVSMEQQDRDWLAKH